MRTPYRPRTIVLLGGLIAIVLWQFVFFRHGFPQTTLESPYRLEASGGVLPWQEEFVYFLYYLNLYPVASISTSPHEYSVEGARCLIAEQGDTLVMDRYWTIRYGDMAKTYLYLPHVWLKGRPAKPRMLHANAFVFTLALLALFAALWSVEKTLLGALLVLLIGSNPFQVHQVYANNNVFGWPITLTVLLLALHIPLMLDRPPRLATALAIPVLSGLLLGSLRQIRSEPVLVIVSAVGIYLTASRLRYRVRLTLVLLLVAAFASTAAAWTRYFEAKYREAYKIVKGAGGHVFEGPRHSHHFIWHAVWCGLGDFDHKYGYQWSDLSAFRYAWPIMQRRQFQAVGYPPVRPDPWDSLTLGLYWDKGRHYARTPFEVPEYVEVARDKVLRDIIRDPLWYASILGSRVARLLSEGTPPSLALGNGLSVSLLSPPRAEPEKRGGEFVPIIRPARQAFWGYLTLAVMVWLLVKQDWFHLKLLAFTLPLTATALLVYSGGGTTYYSIMHLVAVAVVAEGVWELGERRLGPLVGERALPVQAWSVALRRAAAFGLAGLLLLFGLLFGLGTFARRLVTPTSAVPHSADGPQVAILRFDNQTLRESVAWVSDAVGELLAAEMIRAGVRVLDPEAVAWLDSDLVMWTPYSVLSGPRSLAVNVIADRSGAERIVAGRVYEDQRGLHGCIEVLAPPGPASVKPEQCDRLDPERLFETPGRLVRAILPVLGVVPVKSPAPPPASVEAFRLYTEARRAIRRLRWGEAVRLLGQSLHEDPRLVPAQLLQARVWSRWRLPPPGGPRDIGSPARLRQSVEALRAEVATNPLSTEARVDLARMLIDLELLDEAVEVLSPLLKTPGVPAEAFGLLATTHSSLGSMDRGYQALLEFRRRSWQEPRGLSLMADHLTRWGYFDLATQALDNAESERPPWGMPLLTLDDLMRRWDMSALQGDWAEAQQLASRMIPLDDPRAAGAGTLHLARGYLFQGRGQVAGALAEEAAFHLAQQHMDAAEAIGVAVEIRLERGDAPGALDLIRKSRAVGSSRADHRVSFWETVALARLGRWEEAEGARKRLAEDLSEMPGPVGRRLLYHLDGELSLLRGDPSRAVSSLSEAAKLLPARGFCGDHVPVWYALSRANLAAGRPEQAKTWLERITGAASERLCWPIPFARSFSLLGQIAAAAGRHEKAAQAFERFLQLWGQGDLATTEGGEARRFLLGGQLGAAYPSPNRCRAGRSSPRPTAPALSKREPSRLERQGVGERVLPKLDERPAESDSGRQQDEHPRTVEDPF